MNIERKVKIIVMLGAAEGHLLDVAWLLKQKDYCSADLPRINDRLKLIQSALDRILGEVNSETPTT